MPSVATVSLLVRDYDEAIAFYCGRLGFALVADAELGGGKRWVVVSPGPEGAGLLLAQAATPGQAARIGEILEVPLQREAEERPARGGRRE